MTRKYYDEQLDALHAELINMGQMISGAIGKAVAALLSRDTASAREVIAYDEEVDRQERAVETMCYKLLLSQQPVAGDLRRVSSALKIITDMERIGDHAADISELTLMLDALPRMSNAHLREMAAQTTEMLLHSLEAYVEQDMDKAHAVIAQDDAVDALFVAVKRDLVEADERDTGLRQLLNLGHTVGHAIEALSGFGITHGHAVAAGMAIVTRAAVAHGLCEPDAIPRLGAALVRCGLPTGTDFPLEALAEAMTHDKKRSGDRIALIIPRAVGRCERLALPMDGLSSWLAPGM